MIASAPRLPQGREGRGTSSLPREGGPREEILWKCSASVCPLFPLGPWRLGPESRAQPLLHTIRPRPQCRLANWPGALTFAGMTNGHGRLVSFHCIFAQLSEDRKASCAERAPGESSRWRECSDEASTRGRPRRQIGCGDQGDAERRLVIFCSNILF